MSNPHATPYRAATYRGWIRERDYGEAMDVLFLDPSDEPLARRIQDDFDLPAQVSVRYFTANREATLEQFEENLIRRISGALEVDYGDAYSDITGYLWTDEDLVVGGHDLLEELRTHVGRFCHLEMAT